MFQTDKDNLFPGKYTAFKALPERQVQLRCFVETAEKIGCVPGVVLKIESRKFFTTAILYIKLPAILTQLKELVSMSDEFEILGGENGSVELRLTYYTHGIYIGDKMIFPKK